MGSMSYRLVAGKLASYSARVMIPVAAKLGMWGAIALVTRETTPGSITAALAVNPRVAIVVRTAARAA
jgi:hypothetical protein